MTGVEPLDGDLGHELTWQQFGGDGQPGGAGEIRRGARDLAALAVRDDDFRACNRRLFARRVGVVVQYGEVGGAAVMGYFDADIKVSEADVRLACDGGHARAFRYACWV